MKKDALNETNPRREFLGKLATGAAVIGLGSMVLPVGSCAQPAATESGASDADKWFDKVKGKHKVVFDCTRPHEVFPFAWPKVFMITNEKTGTAKTDLGIVVILRHEAIGYAFDNPMWEKYKFGEMFKADDHLTKKPATRNPFWKPAAGEYKVPGIGEVQIGINELQADGVMFCVCEMAMAVYTAVAADMMKMKPEDVKKDWMSALIPGIQPVPSGVWACGRAQEKGCAYVFAG